MKLDKFQAAESRMDNLPLGVTKTENGLHVCVTASGSDCALVIWENKGEDKRRIPFPKERRIGDVWSVDLIGEDFEDLYYCLEVDGKLLPDSYAGSFIGREIWGNLDAVGTPEGSKLLPEDFDWGSDKNPKTPYEESFIYQIHVRGFTKHASSHVQDRGTFKAIEDKIGYLKKLGITAIELLPSYEFSEIIMPDACDGNPYGLEKPTGRINYWGFTPGYYFAPKASYASGKMGGVSRELKHLVKELHCSGIEIMISLYFAEGESPSLMRDVVRFWVKEYHVDGVHLSGSAETDILLRDPYLTQTKMLANHWNCKAVTGTRFLGECNDGFQIDMRRVLKGDEDQINNLIFRTKQNPKECGIINYMASSNGFTMSDMVSYEMKHNEANGENNRDGSECNYTWNCGIEGPSRKKKLVEMRKKQLRNAFLLLFLSQGTPLLLAGDEFGATKGGNNNSYCQDNDTSWLNWNLLHTNRELFEFVKHTADFRKKHPVFHRPEEPKVMDYLACGHPDVSYHGVKAWRPEFENFRRQLGIMYCGAYSQKADGTQDDYFFVAYNMHWEPHEFDLPKLPKKMTWHLAFNTDEGERNGIYIEGEELLLPEQRRFMVSSRSIVVFSGFEDKRI